MDRVTPRFMFWKNPRKSSNKITASAGVAPQLAMNAMNGIWDHESVVVR